MRNTGRAREVARGAVQHGTARIRMASAVTVLSSDDPVRVFERFHLDRAEQHFVAEHERTDEARAILDVQDDGAGVRSRVSRRRVENPTM